MPFVLLFIGILLVAVAATGSYTDLGAQLYQDFSGPGNFLYWIVALGFIGALGYIKPLQPVSRALIGLIILAIFFNVTQKGWWTKLSQGIAR
jgi:hypothetical protein